MRTYDHGAAQDGRKEYEESEEKGKLKKNTFIDINLSKWYTWKKE